MSIQRHLSPDELLVISTLLSARPDTAHFLRVLDKLRVVEMQDGGMGSLLLVPSESVTGARIFGKRIVSGEFKDSDGIPVVVSINIDRTDQLFELDVWKVNFAPRLRWPKPSEISIHESEAGLEGRPT